MKSGMKVVWRSDNIDSDQYKEGIIYTVKKAYTFGETSALRLHIEGVPLPSLYKNIGTFARRFRVASPEEIATLPHHHIQ